MFLYNIHYDNESNTISGDRIILAAGIHTNSRIALSANNIDENFDLYIDFCAPKNRKFRSEKMEFIDGKYYLTIPNSVAIDAGNVEFQLIFVGNNSIEKSLVSNNLLQITPSINAVESTNIDIDMTVIDSLVIENVQQKNTIDEHENKINNNEASIEKVISRLDKHNSNLDELDTKITNNLSELNTLKAKDSEYDKTILEHTSLLNEQGNKIDDNKTIVNSLLSENLEQNTRLSECENSLVENEKIINETMIIANSDKFITDVIYDMSSPSANINHGFPNGLKWREKITGLDLSKYRFLIINCQFDRNLTMVMDLTERNNKNNFYINSIMGCSEVYLKYALIAFEIIVNVEKTFIELNNTIQSASYSAGSELIPDKNVFVSKIYGIE